MKVAANGAGVLDLAIPMLLYFGCRGHLYSLIVLISYLFHLFLLNSNLDFSIVAPKWHTFSYSFECFLVCVSLAVGGRGFD